MEIKTERMVAYGLGIILLVIGIVCYAAFPNSPPENPVRILHKSAAGSVLFDMKEHTDETGFGIACIDCHHDIESESETPEACKECHVAEKEESEGELNTQDAFHNTCIGCHEEDGMAPVDCDKCHRIG